MLMCLYGSGILIEAWMEIRRLGNMMWVGNWIRSYWAPRISDFPSQSIHWAIHVWLTWMNLAN